MSRTVPPSAGTPERDLAEARRRESGQAQASADHRPSRTKLYGLLLLLLVVWAINYVVAKVAVRDAPAFLVVCLRTTISGALMAAYLGWQRRAPAGDAQLGRRRRPTAKDLPRLLAIGAGGIVGNQALFVVGIALTSVAHASILAALTPMMVLLGSAAIGTERLTRRKLLGGAVAAAGVVVLQLARSRGATASSGHPSFGGDLVVLASTVLFTGFAVFGKRAASEFGATAVNVVGYVGGALLLLPFTLWQLAVHPLRELGRGAWFGVVYMGVAPSLVGYMIYAYALKWLPASRVAAVSYLQPLLATGFAVLLLGERPGPGFALAAALVLGGVWVASFDSGASRPRPG